MRTRTKPTATAPRARRVSPVAPWRPSREGPDSSTLGSPSFASAAWQVEGTLGLTFNAWQIVSPAPPFSASYGFNQELFSVRFQHGLALDPRSFKGVHIHVVPSKEATPVLFDSAWPGCALRMEHKHPPMIERMGESFGCINRHHGCINGLFMDGSVRIIGLKELWTLKWRPDFNTRGRWTKAGGVQPEDWPEWMRGFKDY